MQQKRSLEPARTGIPHRRASREGRECGMSTLSLFLPWSPSFYSAPARRFVPFNKSTAILISNLPLDAPRWVSLSNENRVACANYLIICARFGLWKVCHLIVIKEIPPDKTYPRSPIRLAHKYSYISSTISHDIDILSLDRLHRHQGRLQTP